jgi:glycosyltransferase involved in cell wall biosynthesis
MVGRLAPEKRHDLLFSAIAALRTRTDRAIAADILGVGPEYGSLLEMARELGIADNLSFVGFVDDPSPYIKRSDVLVVSSDYEGFGNVLIEALACGVPVISTDVPFGPRYILNGGEFGTLVPAGDAAAIADALLDLLAAGPLSPPERLRLARRASHFSADSVAERLTAIAEAVVSSGPLPPTRF